MDIFDTQTTLFGRGNYSLATNGATYNFYAFYLLLPDDK